MDQRQQSDIVTVADHDHDHDHDPDHDDDPAEGAVYPMERRCPFDPPAEVTRMREEGGARRVTIWNGSRPWIFTHFDDARVVLSDPRFSADKSRPGFPLSSEVAAAEVNVAPTLLVMDGERHAAARRTLLPEFTVTRSEQSRPIIEKLVDACIDELLDRPQPADFVSLVALPTALSVICELLGVPAQDKEFFRSRTATMNTIGLTVEQATEARRELHEYLVALVHERNQRPGDDFLSRLAVKHVRTGTMTEDVLAAMALLVLTAGHDTAANMMSLGVLALLQNPDQFEVLRRHPAPSVVSNAAEELLRYLTVVQRGIRRIALEDVDVNGHPVRAGEGVIAAINAANRDNAHFEQGDDLRLTSPARHHLAFGYGNHQCLGQVLARVELQAVYGAVARRIPTLRLAVPFGDLRFKSDMAVYGVHELPVAW